MNEKSIIIAMLALVVGTSLYGSYREGQDKLRSNQIRWQSFTRCYEAGTDPYYCNRLADFDANR